MVTTTGMPRHGTSTSTPAEKKMRLSRDMGFPSMWYVRPAKAQTSLRIRAV